MDRHARRPGVRVERATARPVGGLCLRRRGRQVRERLCRRLDQGDERRPLRPGGLKMARPLLRGAARSEEHTSELQSLMRISYAVFCLKKKKTSTEDLQRPTANK